MTNEITIVKGDTATFTITITEDGSAKNLTGYETIFTAKKNYDDSDDKAIIGPKIVTVATPATGIGVLTITSSESNKLVGDYYYDVQISTDVGGAGEDIKTPIVSELTITNDVTIKKTI